MQPPDPSSCGTKAGLGTITAVAGLAALAGLLSAPAIAQQPPAAAIADPAYGAAQAAFLALPAADRGAIQDALVWTGDYKGVVDGQFGRGTRDSIVAYARRSHLPTDGTLDDKARASLSASAAKAKQAVGFAPATDARSGVRIGVPVKLLPKTSALTSGTRYASTDATTSLETAAAPLSEGNLPAMFDRLTANTPGRKVTYKVLKPDFLVVAGTAPNGIFYTRMTSGTVGGAAIVRGYTLIYPTALKAQFDIVSVAIANAFEPFPAAAAPPPLPQGPKLVASALAIGPARVLTILPPTACPQPQVAGRSASVARKDAATSLVLLDVPGLEAPPATRHLPFAAAPEDKTPVIVLFETAAAATDKPASELVAAAGETLAPLSATETARIAAPLQGPATGAAVFDRSGALVGLVAAVPKMPRGVAGIVPSSAYSLVAAPALDAFLGSAEPAAKAPAEPGAIRTAAEIAGEAGSSILPVVCAL